MTSVRPLSLPVPPGPVRVAVPGRTLLLVAGVPGAGKSTLLAALPAEPDVVVLDSERRRAAVARMLPGLAYRRVRPLVHLLHRLAVVGAALSRAPTVVVHLPATARATRAVVALLAAVTGRDAHLLWLRVDPDDALRGQRERGRVLRSRSFAAHARRAAATTADLLVGRRPAGWCTVTIAEREQARRGLRLDAGPRRPARGGSGARTGETHK